MTDEFKTSGNGGTSSSTGATWREVGKQFEDLGKSLAEAVRITWTSEENRRRLQEMRTGLETMVKEVSQAINESMTSPQAQQAKSQVGKTAESLRVAGEQSAQELRDQLLVILQQVNDELGKLTKRMESGRPAGDTQPTEPPSAER